VVCRRKNLAYIFCLLFSSHAAALNNYKASYNVYYRGAIVGKSTNVFHVDKSGNYDFTWTSKTTVPLTNFGFKEKSQGVFKSNLIIPKHYSFDSHELKKDKHISTELDGAYDRASVMIALRQSFIDKKPKLTYTVLEKEKLKKFQFHIVKEEKIKTKLGSLNTIKLYRESKSGKHRSTIWLAKDLDYFIVRMMQEKDGKLVTKAEITHIEQ